MNTALVALTVLTMAAAPPGKQPLPPLGSPPPPPKGAAPSTSAPPPPAGAATTPPGSASAPPPGKPSSSMVDLVETLYKKQQFESADIVLGKALTSPETTHSDRVQLHVLEGMLRMESFQEPQARKAFQDALNLDREAKLPDFAPPATRQLFLDVKATLPAVATPVRTTTPQPSKPRQPRTPPGPYDAYLPFIPIALGGVTLATGGGFVIASRTVDTSLRGGTANITTADGLRTTVANGKLYQTAGYTMVGVGGAVLLGGLIWKLAPDIAPLISVNVAPTDRGFATVVSGSLP